MEIVSEKEYQSMFKVFEGMTFTPFAELIEGSTIEVINGVEVETPVFTYKILKTADQVYNEYLEEKKKPAVVIEPVEDQVETLKAKIQTLEQDMADLLLIMI